MNLTPLNRPQDVRITESMHMTEWQPGLNTLKARDEYILKNSMWTDCSFLVGRHRKEYECHRLLLAQSSPYFARLLYGVGPKSQKDPSECMEILLPDIEPRVFDMILNLIYGQIDTKELYPAPLKDEDWGAYKKDRKLQKLLYQAAVKLQLPVRALQKMYHFWKHPDDYWDRKRKPKKICYCWAFQDTSLNSKGRPNPWGLKWQHRSTSVVDRNKQILKRQLWTDCEFSVGQDEKIFRCHSLMLAKTSPVFAAMLCNYKWKSGTIYVPDVTPEAFRLLIQYVYEGRISERRMTVVWDTLAAAKKYFFPEQFLNDMRALLWAMTWPGRVWRTLQLAEMYEEDNLVRSAWEIVIRKPEHCMKLKDFLEISSTTLVSMAAHEDLCCMERDLLDGCLAWGRHQVALRGGDGEDPVAVRALLQDVLPHLRLLILGKKLRPILKATKGVFTPLEIDQLEACVAHKEGAVVPPNFSDVLDSRRQNTDSFFVYGAAPEVVPLRCKSEDGYGRKDEDFTMSSFVLHCTAARRLDSFNLPKKRHLLEGITVPTQNQPWGCTEQTYREDMTVLAIDRARSTILDEMRFKGVVNYNDVLELQFRWPVLLYKKRHNMVIQVILHKTGEYPTRLRGKETRGPKPSKYKLKPAKARMYVKGKAYTDPSFRFIRQTYFSLKRKRKLGVCDKTSIYNARPESPPRGRKIDMWSPWW